jgi:hypothetical protein
MMKSPMLDEVIETATGEREVHRALEWYAWVVMKLVTNDHSFVVSEFSLGGEYKADFVVADYFSGGWEIHFIELEPPSMSPFNKNGDFSPRLNHAAGQVRKWKQFEDRHDKRPFLMSRLRDAIIAKDLTWADRREPLDSQGGKLTDPESVFLMEYHVIMGRRRHLNSELMARKAALIKTDGFELITYDRVLDEYLRQRADATYTGTVRPPT